MEQKLLNEKNYIQNDTEIKLNEIVEQVKNNCDLKQIKSITWWKQLPRDKKFNIGDVVFISQINKYGIISSPAKKEGLVKIVMLKKHISKGSYNREWYVPLSELQLVRRHSKIQKGFICVHNKFYKIER